MAGVHSQALRCFIGVRSGVPFVCSDFAATRFSAADSAWRSLLSRCLVRSPSPHARRTLGQAIRPNTNREAILSAGRQYLPSLALWKFPRPARMFDRKRTSRLSPRSKNIVTRFVRPRSISPRRVWMRSGDCRLKELQISLRDRLAARDLILALPVDERDVFSGGTVRSFFIPNLFYHCLPKANPRVKTQNSGELMNRTMIGRIT